MLWPPGSWLETVFSATNHWSVSIGSTTWPVRVQIGTLSLFPPVSTKTPHPPTSPNPGLPPHEAVQATVLCRRVVVDAGLQRQHHDHWQLVALAHGVVVLVMRRCD